MTQQDHEAGGDRVTEPLIYPRDFLSKTRVRLPQYSDFIDEAEIAASVAEAMAGRWRDELIVPVLPLAGKPLSLRIRCAVFSVLVSQRGTSLPEGLARELEADAFFPAAAVARSLMELLGLTALARQRIPEARVEPLDVERLHKETFRFLFGSRQFQHLGAPTNFLIPDLLEAAQEQLGSHFGGDYGMLAEIAHPNSVVLWAMQPGESAPRFEIQGINDANAELLLKVCGQGLRAILHNCTWPVDWSTENDVALPFVEAKGDVELGGEDVRTDRQLAL
jgi:hypothetical protein